jgi:hypothetical protein
MASYFLTGQESKPAGGVGFASNVQVIAPDGSVQVCPVQAHGGYLDPSMESYDFDDSLCFMDAVSDLDHGAPPPETTNLATEQRSSTEGFAMQRWNLDDNSNDGYNSIPSEGSWSWSGSTSGGEFGREGRREGLLHTVYDNVKTSFRDQQDDESGHGSEARLAAPAKATALSVDRAKAAVRRATTGHGSGHAGAVTTTLATGRASVGEHTTMPNTFYDRIKSAFRDQTEDQTGRGGSSSSARMATPSNAQTTLLLQSPAIATTRMTPTGSGAAAAGEVGRESTMHDTLHSTIQTALEEHTENQTSSHARAAQPTQSTPTPAALSRVQSNATVQLSSSASACVLYMNECRSSPRACSHLLS